MRLFHTVLLHLGVFRDEQLYDCAVFLDAAGDALLSEPASQTRIKRGAGGSCDPPALVFLLVLIGARNRKVTIWARVQPLPGLKVPSARPLVMLFSMAHDTAS